MEEMIRINILRTLSANFLFFGAIGIFIAKILERKKYSALHPDDLGLSILDILTLY